MFSHDVANLKSACQEKTYFIMRTTKAQISLGICDAAEEIRCIFDDI